MLDYRNTTPNDDDDDVYIPLEMNSKTWRIKIKFNKIIGIYFENVTAGPLVLKWIKIWIDKVIVY